MHHLGEHKYPIVLPFVLMLAACGLLELISYTILPNPEAVGVYAIFVLVALIIYCAFRSGLRGGFIAAVMTLVYYGYIIYTHNYTGQQLRTSIETVIYLGVLYFLLAGIIGWLKQRIDTLIDREANEKRRLQSIIQQLPVGVVITDNNGKIEYANKQLEEIMGRPIKREFVVGKDTVLAHHKGKVVGPNQWPLAYTLSTGRSVAGKEYTLQRADGKKIYLNISASPIHSRDGKVIAAASIINDVTQQKLLEERKDDFVNMASHELKTPITSMKLYVELLLKKLKKTDEKTVSIVSSIKNQTERLQKLVNDLLDVSRLQTGKLTFNKERFKLDVLVEEIVDVLQASTKHTILQEKKGSVFVYADRFRIYQVLTNLITNAIKYSPEGKHIRVRIKRTNGNVVVSVQDEGIGIASDQQKKIFHRLYQVVDDTENTFPGFGMGLFISKEIITRHRGKIWVESEKGRGSTFFFSLPIVKE